VSTTEVDLGLLRIPSVRRFLASSALSRTGISLMLPVLFEQAYDITGVPLTIGIIGLLQFVPAVLLVFLSGHLADRFDRRRVTALMTVGRRHCCAGRRAEPSRPALDTPVSYWLPPAASPTIISGATLV
jgi:MFS family permease